MLLGRRGRVVVVGALSQQYSRTKIMKKQSLPPPPPLPLQNSPQSIQLTKEGFVRIIVNAKPGAKQSIITNISDEGVGVQIHALAKDGQANEELLSYLAEILNVKKRDVTLDKGAKSRDKIILVENISVQTAFDKLKLALEKE